MTIPKAQDTAHADFLYANKQAIYNRVDWGNIRRESARVKPMQNNHQPSLTTRSDWSIGAWQTSRWTNRESIVHGVRYHRLIRFKASQT